MNKMRHTFYSILSYTLVRYYHIHLFDTIAILYY